MSFGLASPSAPIVADDLSLPCWVFGSSSGIGTTLFAFFFTSVLSLFSLSAKTTFILEDRCLLGLRTGVSSSSSAPKSRRDPKFFPPKYEGFFSQDYK